MSQRAAAESSLGAMRRRLVIETPTRAPDAMGGAVETWLPLATVYGDVIPVSGAESYQAQRITGRVTHTIWVRDRPDLNARHRFRTGTRLFQIHAVLLIGTLRPRLKCLCEERDQ